MAIKSGDKVAIKSGDKKSQMAVISGNLPSNRNRSVRKMLSGYEELDRLEHAN